MIDWNGLDQLVARERRQIVASFIDFLRLNTVSQEPEQVRRGGEWLLEVMRSRGLDARILLKNTHQFRYACFALISQTLDQAGRVQPR